MSKKKICFIAQFPPPMHGLSKAVETLYNSELNTAVDSNGEFEFEKVDITNNKNFVKNLLKISRSKADLFYFTISQTRGGNLRDLVIFKLLELQHKKCLIHLHGGYYRQLVDNDMAGWQRKANYKAIKKLAGAIVLSKSLEKIFKGMIDDDKIFVVENCVDDQYLLTDQEIEEKLVALRDKKVLHVLWLSNFIRSKGYPFVLEMAKAEKERVDAGGEKRFHFDFAGKFFEDNEKTYFEKKRSHPSRKMFAIAVIGALLFISIMGFMRHGLRTGSVTDWSSFSIDDILYALETNFNIYKPFYGLVTHYPSQYAYTLGGSMIYDTITHFIPRAIWPGKPLAIYSTMAIAMKNSTNAFTLDHAAMAWPNLGEYYMEFGIIGSVLIMFWFGRALKKSIRLYESTAIDDIILYAVFYGFTMQIITRGYTPTIVGLLIFLYLPAIVIRAFTLKGVNIGVQGVQTR